MHLKNSNFCSIFPFVLIRASLLSQIVAINDNDILGEEFVENIVQGEKLSAKPELLFFTAPYKICEGGCSNQDYNFEMAFPLYVGAKGKYQFKNEYPGLYKEPTHKPVTLFQPETTSEQDKEFQPETSQPTELITVTELELTHPTESVVAYETKLLQTTTDPIIFHESVTPELTTEFLQATTEPIIIHETETPEPATKLVTVLEIEPYQSTEPIIVSKMETTQLTTEPDTVFKTETSLLTNELDTFFETETALYITTPVTEFVTVTPQPTFEQVTILETKTTQPNSELDTVFETETSQPTTEPDTGFETETLEPSTEPITDFKTEILEPNTDFITIFETETPQFAYNPELEALYPSTEPVTDSVTETLTSIADPTNIFITEASVSTTETSVIYETEFLTPFEDFDTSTPVLESTTDLETTTSVFHLNTIPLYETLIPTPEQSFETDTPFVNEPTMVYLTETPESTLITETTHFNAIDLFGTITNVETNEPITEKYTSPEIEPFFQLSTDLEYDISTGPTSTEPETEAPIETKTIFEAVKTDFPDTESNTIPYIEIQTYSTQLDTTLKINELPSTISSHAPTISQSTIYEPEINNEIETVLPITDGLTDDESEKLVDTGEPELDVNKYSTYYDLDSYEFPDPETTSYNKATVPEIEETIYTEDEKDKAPEYEYNYMTYGSFEITTTDNYIYVTNAKGVKCPKPIRKICNKKKTTKVTPKVVLDLSYLYSDLEK